jgi:hypothetical protein
MTPNPSRPALRHALDYWQRKRAELGRLPRWREIDVAGLKPSMGRMLLLELAQPIEDSRYRVFGTVLVEYFKEELTERRLGDTGGAKNRTLIAEYAEVVRTGAPMMFSNEPIIGSSVFRYEKVALPLLNDADEIGYILAVIDQLPEP